MTFYEEQYFTKLQTLVSHDFIAYIENNFYSLVNEKAKLDALVRDPTFLRDPINHVGLYSDHGIIHVRDVATKILRVLTKVNGVHIKRRDEQQLNFMQQYGAHVALLHDIGMCDFTAFGRFMHPEFGTQLVYSADFDPMLEFIWHWQPNFLVERIEKLSSFVGIEAKLFLREVLAFANCHSKTKVAITKLDNPEELRQLLLSILQNNLVSLCREQQLTKLVEKFSGEELSYKQHQLDIELMQWQKESSHLHPQVNLARFYRDVEQEAFVWLKHRDWRLQTLVHDIQDTLRCLRAADALRQRGIALKTSGGYQIFLDQVTGDAVYALKKSEDEMFLLAVDRKHGAGEANIAFSNFTDNGDLHIAFYRGQFYSAKATQTAAANAAHVVVDIEADVANSFNNNKSPIRLLIENCADNYDFSLLVRAEIKKLNPDLVEQICFIPPLKDVDKHEVELYLHGESINWSASEVDGFVKRIADTGHKVDKMDIVHLMDQVRKVKLVKDQMLIKAATKAAFVFVPLSPGLIGKPKGGYPAFYPAPYFILGNTGVIMGAIRNADVVATESLEVLMIPQETYLRYWHDMYNVQEIINVLQHRYQIKSQEEQ